MQKAGSCALKWDVVSMHGREIILGKISKSNSLLYCAVLCVSLVMDRSPHSLIACAHLSTCTKREVHHNAAEGNNPASPNSC